MTTTSPSEGLTEDANRLVTGAILHGKIGGLERALQGLAVIEKKGGDLSDLREWILRVIGVNRKMLAIFRETGEVPEEDPGSHG